MPFCVIGNINLLLMRRSAEFQINKFEELREKQEKSRQRLLCEEKQNAVVQTFALQAAQSVCRMDDYNR